MDRWSPVKYVRVEYVQVTVTKHVAAKHVEGLHQSRSYSTTTPDTNVQVLVRRGKPFSQLFNMFIPRQVAHWVDGIQQIYISAQKNCEQCYLSTIEPAHGVGFFWLACIVLVRTALATLVPHYRA